MYNDPYQHQQGQPSQPPQSPYSSPYDSAYGQYGQPSNESPYGSTYGAPPNTQYNVPQGPQPPYGPPAYGMPPMPPMPPIQPYIPPPQKQHSLTWLWITLGIVGGLLVLSCAACGVFFYNASKQAANLVGPAFAVGEYYQYLKLGDYSKAYTFVDPNAIYTLNGQTVSVTDEQSFAHAAQTVDTTDGTITTSAVSGTGTDTTHITMTVTRNGSPYDVHLTLAQVSGIWKIIGADGI